MRKPTPVTTSSITAESGSESRPNLMVSPPEVSHVQKVVSAARAVAGMPSIEMKSTTAATKAPQTTPQPISPMSQRGSTRPQRPSVTKPARGSARMSQVRFCMRALALQGVQLVHVDRAASAENRHDDGKADHHLGGGDRQHQEDEHPAVHRVQEARKGHEGQVDGVEHQLDGHEHHERVAADQPTKRTDGEETP